MSIADELFDVQIQYNLMVAQVETEIIKIVGNCSDDENMTFDKFEYIVFDQYSAGFELNNCIKGLTFNENQLKKFWELGFERCWLCYTDGTEEYFYKKK